MRIHQNTYKNVNSPKISASIVEPDIRYNFCKFCNRLITFQNSSRELLIEVLNFLV